MKVSQQKSFASSAISISISLVLSLFGVIAPISKDVALATISFNNGVCNLSGTGTEGDPYLVSTADELWDLSDCAGYIELQNDIDASRAVDAQTNSPIGSLDNTPARYLGYGGAVYLNGNGKTIRYQMTRSSNAGLFSKISQTTISNLILSGSVFTSTTTDSSCNFGAGGLAVETTGLVVLSSVSSAVNVTGYKQVGGLIGCTGGQIRFESVAVSSSVESSGGIAGGFLGRSNGDVSINLSGFSGEVSGPSDLGGLMGVMAPSATKKLTVSSSVNSGKVSATGLSSGGLVGNLQTAATIINSDNSGDIDGDGFVGGFVGYSVTYPISISDSFNHGEIVSTGAYPAAGLVSHATGATSFLNSENAGSISSSGQAAGFLGYAGANSTIQGSTNSSTVSAGGSFAAGFIGSSALNTRITISGSINLGLVKSTNYDGSGGFIGRSNGETLIQDSTNSGVISKSTHVAGGAVGEVTGGLVSIVSFTNLADVSTGTGNVAGGIVGYANNNGRVQIENSVNLGDISGGTGVGGIIGGNYLNPLTVSSTINRGEVHGLKSVGGILGKLGDSSSAGKANLVRVANLGTVSATTYYAGGLIGEVVHASSATDILQAFNSGTVQATTQYAGGLVGFGTGMYSITQSFNVGQVSAPSVVGGIAGSINQFSLVETYNAGSVSNVVHADGLVQAGTAILVSISYTATNSRLTISSTEEALRDIDTYENWDFDDVWGIGSCDANGGLPFLVWAAGLVFDLSCLNVQQTPQLVQPQTPPVAPVELGSAPADPYSGPILTSKKTVVFRGESVTLEGSKLDQVSEAFVLDVQIQILDATSKSITLLISSSTELGLHDLVFISSHGRLTTMEVLDVREAPIADVSPGELLGFAWTLKFAGNSRDLSARQQDAVLASSERFQQATTVICWGYTTADSPNAWALMHASQRAENACQILAKARPDLKTVVRIRTGQSKNAAMRTSMQFWMRSNEE